MHGKHYTVTDVIGLPKPVQQPHPPIMIGGTGEKVLLKLVAKHADMWNASAGAERMGHLIEVIERHGETVGRDTGAIEKTVMIPLAYKADRTANSSCATWWPACAARRPRRRASGIMIGDKQECLDTIERYRKVGRHAFHLHAVPTVPRGRAPGVRGGGDSRCAAIIWSAAACCRFGVGGERV